MDIGVEGLRVLITAGGGGIGLAIAEEFASGGALVAVCDTDGDVLDRLSARGSGISGWRADVGDESQVAAFVDGAIAELGGVDVLVNNAGVAGPAGRVEELDVDGWRHALDVNITGMFLTSRLVVPHLKSQRSGSIVNISSSAGLHGMPYRAPYVASKWAVIGFTKTLAMELGEFGVRANAICPGSVDNERMKRVIELESSVSGRTPEEIRAGFARQVSLQTFMQPADIAAMIRFICSPAGAHISGQALSVDGHTESMRT